MTSFGTLFRRFGRDASGAAIVEFAMIAPLLFALTLGAIDGGRAMLAFNSVEKLAKDGARFASVRGSEYSSPATESDIRDYVKSRASGLDSSNLNVNVDWPVNNDPGEVVNVQVTYVFTSLLMVSAPLTFDRTAVLNIMR